MWMIEALAFFALSPMLYIRTPQDTEQYGHVLRVSVARDSLNGLTEAANASPVPKPRALIDEYDVPRLSAVVGWVVLPVYVAIVILALVPTIPADLGLALSAIQVEAILVSLVLFLGVQAAWILLVEPPRASQDEAAKD